MKLRLLAFALIVFGTLLGIRPAFGQTVDERLKRVVDEIVKMQYDTAMNDMNEVLKVDANNALAFEYRGLAHVGKREFTEAVADYTKAINLKPGAASFYSNRAFAVQLLPKPDYTGAYDDLTEAIKINPNDKSYYLDRGYPALMKQDFDQAARDYTQAIALGENSSEVYINRGMASINLQYYSQAINDCRQALALDPGNAVATRNLDLAISLRKKTASQKAIEKLIAEGLPESASQNESAEAAQKFARAVEMIKAEDHKKAQEILYSIGANDLKSAKVSYYLAVDFYLQGDYQKASANAASAISLDPQTAKYYYLRGISRAYDPFIWRYDQIQEALKDMNKVIELDPAYAPAYGQKAQMLFRFSPDSPYASMNAAKESVKVDAKDGESYLIIGFAQIFLTSYKEALAALDQAVANGVTTSEAYEARGYVNFETKNRAQAIADYQRSLELNPDNPVAKKDLDLLIAKSKYTLYPPEPPAANKWVVQMQDLFKKYNDEVSSANSWAHKGGANQAEICSNLSGWNTSSHNANSYALELWSLARSADDKKVLSEVYDSGRETEKKSKAMLDAQKCSF